MPPALLPFRELPSPMQAMLLAARGQQDEVETAALHTLCAEPLFDWQRLTALSLHHSLASLVHAGLGRCCPDLVPSSIRSALQEYAVQNAVRAFRWMREAARLSSALDATGCAVVVLKGVPLSQQLYGSPHARHVGDLDLLTSPSDLASGVLRVKSVFEELGYAMINPVIEFTPRRLESYLHFWKDLTFQHAEEGFDVDLHWRLFNHRMHPANRLLPLSHTTTLTVLGCTVQVLPLPEQFLHVAAHGVSDAWIYLKSLADVAAFLALLTPSELEDALRHAGEIGLLPQVSAAIHVSNAWMGSRAQSSRLLPVDHAFAVQLHAGVSGLLQNRDFTPMRGDRTPAGWLHSNVPRSRDSALFQRICDEFFGVLGYGSGFNLPDTLFWLYPVLGLLLPPRLDSLLRRRGETAVLAEEHLSFRGSARESK